MKKSQEKYLNFSNSAIQEFYDDIELDMNDVNTMFYTCAKQLKKKKKLVISLQAGKGIRRKKRRN